MEYELKNFTDVEVNLSINILTRKSPHRLNDLRRYYFSLLIIIET